MSFLQRGHAGWSEYLLLYGESQWFPCLPLTVAVCMPAGLDSSYIFPMPVSLLWMTMKCFIFRVDQGPIVRKDKPLSFGKAPG